MTSYPFLTTVYSHGDAPASRTVPTTLREWFRSYRHRAWMVSHLHRTYSCQEARCRLLSPVIKEAVVSRDIYTY